MRQVAGGNHIGGCGSILRPSRGYGLITGEWSHIDAGVTNCAQGLGPGVWGVGAAKSPALRARAWGGGRGRIKFGRPN